MEENGGCCGLSAVDDARRVAAQLDIPYYVMNFKDVFREKVMDYFTAEYVSGRTPNPCIACNRYVKWGGALKAQSGYRGGLHCHRPLCPDRAAAKRPYGGAPVGDGCQGSDLRPV